ncbi:acyltransferase, partial [Klebsiella pneumoniae]|nr:acyltransferase [Klebsiella pneumoniae]
MIENLIFAPPLDVSMPVYLGWLHRLPQFNWGAFGVALFFLISGFVIPFSFVKATWLSFLVGRFFRIFPLYAVGF